MNFSQRNRAGSLEVAFSMRKFYCQRVCLCLHGRKYICALFKPNNNIIVCLQIEFNQNQREVLLLHFLKLLKHTAVLSSARIHLISSRV